MIGIELFKQTHRLRGWLTLAAMAAVSAAVVLLIAMASPSIPERLGDWESVVPNSSGLTLPLLALNTMVLFMLPLAAAIAAGDAVAAETGWGTLRYLLAHPVSRARVLASKAVVAALFAVASVLCVLVISLVIGAAAFGWEPLRVVDLQHTTAFHLATATFPVGDGFLRLLMAAVFVVATLGAVFGFAILLSTWTKEPFSAIAGGLALTLVSRALDNIPGLHALSPWLPATDAGTTAWTGFLTTPMQLGPAERTLAVQAVYTVVFLAAAWIRFARLDVVS